MNIKYRDASIEDFNGVVALCLASIDFSVLTKATDQVILHYVASASLASDFYLSDYIKIAEYKGKMCGVLMGITHLVPRSKSIFDYESIIRNANAFFKTSKEGLMVLGEMKQNRKNETSLLKSTVTSDCKGELTFFAVDEKFRHFKIGSTLILNFEAYMKKGGVMKYFVYTDSQCSFQYYDHNGYTCVESIPSVFKSSVQHYTYTKELFPELFTHNPLNHGKN